MNAAAMQGMFQLLRPPPTSMLLQVLEGLQRATAGSKLASYQQTGRRSGAQYKYHTLSWSGDAAMGLLHSWRDAALAAGLWPHLVEKGELIDLMLQWEGAAGLPVRERQQLALDIEWQARRLRFGPQVSWQPACGWQRCDGYWAQHACHLHT